MDAWTTVVFLWPDDVVDAEGRRASQVSVDEDWPIGWSNDDDFPSAYRNAAELMWLLLLNTLTDNCCGAPEEWGGGGGSAAFLDGTIGADG